MQTMVMTPPLTIDLVNHNNVKIITRAGSLITFPVHGKRLSLSETDDPLDSRIPVHHQGSGCPVPSGTPDGILTGDTMTGEPRRTFTRARTVGHTAHSYLSARGYQVFLCSGSQSPIDLIAWSREGHPALIKTERTRVSVSSAAQVAKRYRGDMDALRPVILPHLARVQLWILSPPFGSWRFLTVFPGGIAEVAERTLHYLMHGYASQGVAYNGLLEKCPAIAYTDRTVVADDEMTGASTRRRTNAYTFDQGLYHQWCFGGAVWFDDDPVPTQSPDNTTNPSALLQSFRSPSAGAEGQKNENSSADLRTTSNHTHICFNDHVSFRNPDLTKGVDPTPSCDPLFTCVIGNAEGHDQKTDKRSINGDLEQDKPRITLLHVQNDAVGQSQNAEVVEGHPNQIHAVDYKRLLCPEPQVPCYACQKKGSWYVEKLTAERKARPKDEQAARRVCRKCYDAAVRRDRAASPPLPDVIDLVGMERHAPNIGNCSVCNLGAATYLAEQSGVKLCEACHSRELQRQCHLSEVPI